jgi:CHAT domain-containing protein
MERKNFFFCLSLWLVFSVFCIFCAGLKLWGETDETQAKLKNWEKAQWLREQGRYEESIRILEQEIHRRYSEDEKPDRAISWLNIGLDYWNLGDVDRAQNSFIFILALTREQPDRQIIEFASTAVEIISFYKEAKSRRLKQKYYDSEALFQKALQVARMKMMKEFELKCLRQLSLVYWDQGKLEDYFRANERALQLAGEINHYLEQAYALNNIGLYFFRKNDFFNAFVASDKALYLAERENFSEKSPDFLENLAVFTYHLGNYELSEYYFERAIKIYETAGDIESIISDLSGMAITIYKKQRISKYETNLDEPMNLLSTALELSRRAGLQGSEARILNNIGFVYLESDLDRAEDFSRQAWEKGCLLKDKEVIASSLNNLANVYLRRNEVKKAMAAFERSLSVALEIGNWNEVWKNYSGRAQCYERLRNFHQALMAYQKALETFDKIREKISFDLYKIGFSRDKHDVYEGIIRTLVSLKENNPRPAAYDELIFATFNRIKARNFFEGLGRIEDETKSNEIAFELDRLDREIGNLISHPGYLESEDSSKKVLELEYRYLRILSEENSINNHDNQAIFDEPFSLKFVQEKLLEEGQVLLDYYICQNESYCFVVSRDEYRVIKLPAEKEIENSIRLYVKLLAEPETELEDLVSAGSRIRSFLIPGLENLKNKVNSLIIIPDGLLNYLPFETLTLESSEGAREKKYLIEQFKITYVPSIAALHKLKKMPGRSDYTKELLAFGGPYYSSKDKNRLKSRVYFVDKQLARDGFQLPALPYSRQEVKKVARLFCRSNYDLFLKKKATEDNFKHLNLTDYRILHFACHGLISEHFPQRSALIFSLKSGGNEDGLLTLREIYGLKLKAELVVLSACDTSRGAMEKAEGIIGLPRAFLLSGSQAVVSSLWSVNDRATQELMKDFYRFLLAGERKDEALQKAKLKMIHSNKSHPYYWAAFILTGDARSIY